MNLDFGMFGVSIFFLISGFIVPFSVNRSKESIISFLVKRFIRIFPLYIIIFSFTFLTLSLYAYYRTGEYPYSIKQYLIQASLQRDWFWVSSIDGISWTLEIEIKFYILYAILMLIKKTDSPKVISGISIVTAFACIIYNTTQAEILSVNRNLYIILGVLTLSMTYIIFIFIGLAIYQFYTGNWSKETLLVVMQVLVVTFIISILNSSSSNIILKFIINYGGGLLIFINAYLLREKWHRKINLFNFFAKYSYVIYLIHGINGYILMDILVRKGFGFEFCLVTTIVIILLTSYFFGNFIEKPINRLKNVRFLN